MVSDFGRWLLDGSNYSPPSTVHSLELKEVLVWQGLQ